MIKTFTKIFLVFKSFQAFSFSYLMLLKQAKQDFQNSFLVIPGLLAFALLLFFVGNVSGVIGDWLVALNDVVQLNCRLLGHDCLAKRFLLQVHVRRVLQSDSSNLIKYILNRNNETSLRSHYIVCPVPCNTLAKNAINWVN